MSLSRECRMARPPWVTVQRRLLLQNDISISIDTRGLYVCQPPKSTVKLLDGRGIRFELLPSCLSASTAMIDRQAGHDPTTAVGTEAVCQKI